MQIEAKREAGKKYWNKIKSDPALLEEHNKKGREYYHKHKEVNNAKRRISSEKKKENITKRVEKIVETKKKNRKFQPPKICLNCRKEYTKKEVVESNSSYERKKYCSIGCRREALREQNTKRMKEVGKSLKGTKKSLEFRRYLSEYWGDTTNHPNYKDGKSYDRSSQRQKEMSRLDYRLWREAIFEKDKYICQHCGQKGGKLNADHIKPWGLFPEFRYDVNNGRTLCFECHRKTPTFAGKGVKLTREDFL